MRTRLLLLTLVGLACARSSAPAFRHQVAGPAVPWTHERFDTSSASFSFAIVSDLNGGERPGVFDLAVAQLTLLRPEIVLSVGDLIDGPTTEDTMLTREWNEFDARANAIPAPFFRVGGNHDLTGAELRNVWRRRYGPTYYSFVYRNVLFLVLDTEDLTPERAKQVFDARQEAIRVANSGNASTEGLEYYRMPERMFGNVGAEQASFVQRAVAENPDVRWTFLFFHKPVWRAPDDPEFKSIEAALASRPYTVFAGHVHALSHTLRNGRDYFTLGTTGGSQAPNNPMAFDHLTMVAMTPQGPSIAHLKLEGILGPDGRPPRPSVSSPR
jgi:hypothetical protein